MNCAAIVIGGSAGSLPPLEAILRALPLDFAPTVLIVEHLHSSDDGSFARHLQHIALLPVIEPCDKAAIRAGHVYVAPANYHMLVECSGTISLSVDERVNWSRPSIDVLFESAASVWGEALLGVILSGANSDGAIGLCTIKAVGGHTFAQDPASAESPCMPQAAIDAGAIDEILSAEGIAKRLVLLGANKIPSPMQGEG